MATQTLEKLPAENEPLPFLMPNYRYIPTKGEEEGRTYVVSYKRASPWIIIPAEIIGLGIMTAILANVMHGSSKWIFIGLIWAASLVMLPVFFFIMRQAQSAVGNERLRADTLGGEMTVVDYDRTIPLASIRQIVAVEGMYQGMRRHWTSELSVIYESDGSLLRVPLFMSSKWYTHPIAERLAELAGASFTIHEPSSDTPLGQEKA